MNDARPNMIALTTMLLAVASLAGSAQEESRVQTVVFDRAVQPRNPHSGVDFRSTTGTPVAAPATGVVTAAESLFFTGNTVVIDHGLGLYSLLAHLSKFAVSRGENLTAIARRYGTTIAAVQGANSLGRRTVIRIGQRLRIPTR